MSAPPRWARRAPTGGGPRLPRPRTARLLLCLALGLAAAWPRAGAAEYRPPPGTCLQPEEQALARLLNEHRRARGLPAVRLSRSLSLVARWHAIDLQENDAASGADAQGVPCGLHSWSSRGPWTAVCATGDEASTARLRAKPRELTDHLYPGDGVELVYRVADDGADAAGAASRWLAGAAETALLSEAGPWAGAHWAALGVGIHRGHAVVWLGDRPDPWGVPDRCQPGGPPSGQAPPRVGDAATTPR
ncbi:MAG: CAP domain-containing protein [Deferrisomatales bacterium]